MASHDDLLLGMRKRENIIWVHCRTDFSNKIVPFGERFGGWCRLASRLSSVTMKHDENGMHKAIDHSM